MPERGKKKPVTAPWYRRAVPLVTVTCAIIAATAGILSNLKTITATVIDIIYDKKPTEVVLRDLEASILTENGDFIYAYFSATITKKGDGEAKECLERYGCEKCTSAFSTDLKEGWGQETNRDGFIAISNMFAIKSRDTRSELTLRYLRSVDSGKSMRVILACGDEFISEPRSVPLP